MSRKKPFENPAQNKSRVKLLGLCCQTIKQWRLVAIPDYFYQVMAEQGSNLSVC